MTLDKSPGERRAEMNRADREALERQENEAAWSIYLEERERLRKIPIEETIEQAYEDNKIVDRIIARRRMLLKTIRRSKIQDLENCTFDIRFDKCFVAYPEYGLSSVPYVLIKRGE